MRFLLTNDDGYGAIGIESLKKVLSQYGEVYTVAPLQKMSGKSCSISILNFFDDVKLEKYDEYNYAIDGTPADCVLYALKQLKIDPDVIISGCNFGLNISLFTHYSGTIGACTQARLYNKRAIAFSCFEKNMKCIEVEAKKAMDYILENNLISDDYFLSVNFPYKKKSKGIKFSKYHDGVKDFYYDPVDEKIYKNDKHEINFDDRNDELYAITHGYIAITPMNTSPFDIKTYKQIKKKVK